MSGGPPTPPPTTAVEIEDAAKADQVAVQPKVETSSVAALAIVPPRQDVYQVAFPAIVDLALRHSFKDLIQLAEGKDLNGDGDAHPTRFLISVPLVIAYLIVDDLAPARYVLARLPDALASHRLAKSLHALYLATKDRKHAQVYSLIGKLSTYASQPDFIEPKLGSLITTMLGTLSESFRQQTFALLGRAYTAIPLTLAQEYLGMSETQLIDVAEKSAWSYDITTQVFSPAAGPLSIRSNEYSSVPSTLGTFHSVADSAVKNEA
ncbi:hypothetical protein HGRIS_012981 [Hohenbuehelia grisea]|uniref:CSN8/PSMD8/EIF3K domain-containing protein n=1 Tax=Hohenbuehelia grisea TaxID=104357 RepID=A0ABR3IU06_9AGAR